MVLDKQIFNHESDFKATFYPRNLMHGVYCIKGKYYMIMPKDMDSIFMNLYRSLRLNYIKPVHILRVFAKADENMKTHTSDCFIVLKKYFRFSMN